MSDFDNWQKEFWNRLNQQMQGDFKKQMELTQEQIKKQLKFTEEQVKKSIELTEEQVKKQMGFTQDQARRSIELAMKNAETFLNQHNPTLAMIEFERARLLRNFLRE
jgi:hypothetical protein